MTDPDRKLLLAAVAAAVIGFAAGWYAHMLSEPTPESRANDAAKAFREKLNELTK